MDTFEVNQIKDFGNAHFAINDFSLVLDTDMGNLIVYGGLEADSKTPVSGAYTLELSTVWQQNLIEQNSNNEILQQLKEKQDERTPTKNFKFY